MPKIADRLIAFIVGALVCLVVLCQPFMSARRRVADLDRQIAIVKVERAALEHQLLDKQVEGFRAKIHKLTAPKDDGDK